VVNRDEVDELLVVFDIHIELLDSSRVRIDILGDLCLRLKETLQGCLTERHFL